MHSVLLGVSILHFAMWTTWTRVWLCNKIPSKVGQMIQDWMARKLLKNFGKIFIWLLIFSWQSSYYFTASFSSMWLMHERLSLPAAVWGRVSPDDRWSRDYGSMTSKLNHFSPVFVQFASCHGINGMTALPVKAAHRYILCSYTKYRSWA